MGKITFQSMVKKLQSQRNIDRDQLIRNTIQKTIAYRKSINTLSPLLNKITVDKRRRKLEKEYKQYIVSKQTKQKPVKM